MRVRLQRLLHLGRVRDTLGEPIADVSSEYRPTATGSVLILNASVAGPGSALALYAPQVRATTSERIELSGYERTDQGQWVLKVWSMKYAHPYEA